MVLREKIMGTVNISCQLSLAENRQCFSMQVLYLKKLFRGFVCLKQTKAGLKEILFLRKAQVTGFPRLLQESHRRAFGCFYRLVNKEAKANILCILIYAITPLRSDYKKSFLLI